MGAAVMKGGSAHLLPIPGRAAEHIHVGETVRSLCAIGIESSREMVGRPSMWVKKLSLMSAHHTAA